MKIFSCLALAVLGAALWAAPSSALDWKQASGTTLQVALNKHPYQQAIIDRLSLFEEKTGIKVQYSITPEDNYFDQVTTSLFSKSGNPDVFMCGVYQMWDYATSGYMEPLDKYMNDPKLTDEADFDVKDFIPGIIAGGRWSLKAGDKVGSGSQYLLPLGFEGYALSYNKKVFADKNLTPPKTFAELATMAAKLKDWNGPGSYGVAVRGTRSWATIHPGYMTEFASSGAHDFEIKDGKLVCTLDQPQSVAFTDQFAQMVRQGGPPAWANYTWYQVGADLGSGKAAMILDADILGFFQNVKDATAMSGNIGFAAPPLAKEGAPLKSNMWIWAIGMNSASKNKVAAWLFMAYFTGKEHQTWGAIHASVVDPARQSVLDNPEFAQRMNNEMPGYLEVLKQISPVTGIQFTPQARFQETTTKWAATLQDIVLKQASAKEDLSRLAKETTRAVSHEKVK